MLVVSCILHYLPCTKSRYPTAKYSFILVWNMRYPKRNNSVTVVRNWWKPIHHHHHHHLSLDREGIWGTTNDLTTSFLHFSLSPLPSGTWRTPDLSIPWCCLPTSSSVCVVFFPLSQCLTRWFWPDLMNGRHVHTTAVCVSLRWSGGLRVVRLPAGSWYGLPPS